LAAAIRRPPRLSASRFCAHLPESRKIPLKLPLFLQRNLARRGASRRRMTGMSLALAILGLALVAQLPAKTTEMAQKAKEDVDFRQFANLFSEIYGRIQESYVDPIDNKKLFEGAVNGMMATLDPYSSWLPPIQQDQLNHETEGEYSGVGMHITLDERRILTVLLPIAGSPAAKAGVRPWDRVIEIDGKSTEGISMTDAVTRLTGPTGSSVKIKAYRPSSNKILDFTLKREQIKVESVFHKNLGDGIGYLRIAKFQEDTANGVRAALEDFNKNDIKGIIVDVRFNVGGLLDRVQEICDMFLAKNQVIVSLKGRVERDNRVFYAQHGPLAKQPMIVLVNRVSASASEILAGAIQDNHRGVIIGPKGVRTYGKASVQTISDLRYSLDKDANGNYKKSGLRLTTAHYYTPSGKLIMDKGIKPDIGVDLPAGNEEQLREHGLLGEPSLVEPSMNDNATTTSRKQNDDASGDDQGDDAKQGADAPANQQPKDATHRLVEMLAQSGARAGEKKPLFQDVLLEESIKYLKAIMIVEQARTGYRG
jgi:carboxyl-terminal processing protease